MWCTVILKSRQSVKGKIKSMQNKRQASGRRHKEGFLNFYLKYVALKMQNEASICTQFVCPNPDNKKGVCGINKLFIDFKNLTIVYDGKGVKEIW